MSAGRGAAIWHVDDVDARHRVEQFAGQMCRIPMPAEAKLILPGLALA